MVEKEKFQELLVNTDENLRKMQQEKFIQQNLELKEKIDIEVDQRNAKHKKELHGVMKEREMNFQEYSLQKLLKKMQ